MILKLSDRQWVNLAHVAVVDVDDQLQVTLTLTAVQAGYTSGTTAALELGLDVEESRRFLAFCALPRNDIVDLTREPGATTD